MVNSKFSHHKSMILSNRKTLALYLFKIDRSHNIPEVMMQTIDLDQFDGDRVPLKMVTKLTISHRHCSHGIELYRNILGVCAEIFRTTDSLRRISITT
jgi:hypothetical protein